MTNLDNFNCFSQTFSCRRFESLWTSRNAVRLLVVRSGRISFWPIIGVRTCVAHLKNFYCCSQSNTCVHARTHVRTYVEARTSCRGAWVLIYHHTEPYLSALLLWVSKQAMPTHLNTNTSTNKHAWSDRQVPIPGVTVCSKSNDEDFVSRMRTAPRPTGRTTLMGKVPDGRKNANKSTWSPWYRDPDRLWTNV